jgi:hypothetical protein
VGVCFGSALALGLESLAATRKTPEEVGGFRDIPNLARMPHLEVAAGHRAKGVPELVVHHGSHLRTAEAYRGFTTSIHFSAPHQPPRLLLITSSLSPLMSLTAAAVPGTMVAGVLLVVKDI